MTHPNADSNADDSSDPDDLEAKSSHFQIVAPAFGTTALVPPADDGSTQSMTSFIRLGSATDPEPSSTYGAQLLDAALASSPIAVGNQIFDAITAAAATVSVLTDGCQALANAVVTAAGQYGGDTSSDRIATVKRLAEAARSGTADDPTTSENESLEAARSAAVYAAIGPFVDDTRDQGTANNANGLTPAQRVEETRRLFTKGGWRDHTDGNRVSTTYGDKIEVVRGNYKLVVLGRQDDPGGGHVWESSGGMFQDNDAAPGQLTEIKWVETQGGTWRTIETCSKGDVLTQFDGHVTERFVGGSVTSVVGREKGATSTGALSAAAKAQLQKEYDEDKANKFIDDTTTLDAYYVRRGYGSSSSAVDQYYAEGGANPIVYEQTWASKIESYTGSKTTPVPEIIETTYASNITETTNVNAQSSTTNATSITETVNTGTSTETVTATGAITSITKANSVAEITDVNGKGSGFASDDTGANKIVSKVFANVMHDEFHVTAATEYNLGTKWELIIGVWGTLKIGGSFEIFVGPAFQLSGATYQFTIVNVEGCAFKAEKEGAKLSDIEFDGKIGVLKAIGTGLMMIL